MRAILHRVEVKLRRVLLGTHPNNTILNYNWVNVHPLVQTFRELRPLFQGRVADLGAGLSPYYSLAVSPDGCYIAVDLPQALLPDDTRPILSCAADLHQIPFDNSSLDTIFCTQVISHVLYPEKVLHEMARTLRSGGQAIISVSFVAPIQVEPYDVYRFTPDGLSRLARAAGFETVAVYVQGRLFASIALSIAMCLVLTPLKVGEPMRLRPRLQLLFAPLIGILNGSAFVLDQLLPTDRMPVNFVIVLRK